ncbi:hypothetical protein IQ254_28250 [Nodosilinea sp. LEGE 07088]|uniref:type II toxin-antitoxin system RelE family toxin n=1 Tax=Nodosilinea sp. LEGE 07088 TaxID=2777968 RepID=UPI001881C738|nr:hypothetical protein [Nodosilinea sp. LEGE 07088]MBE9141045.1 hypothetical protein [Nodosilinea sp. LEGE 07088]
MKIKLSKTADKFLKKLDGSSKKTVVDKIGILKSTRATATIPKTVPSGSIISP